MKITFHGAAKIVTGSCFLIETNGTKFLVDCGMFQGPKEIVKLSYKPFKFDPKEISFVLLTHAHADHCALLPKLVKHGFRGKIYSTCATRDLAQIILEDSVDVQKQDLMRKNRRRLRQGRQPRKLLYDIPEVVKTMRQFTTVNYNDTKNINNINFSFRKAGHILGSSIIEIYVEGKKLVFSGDMGQGSNLILEDPQTINEADYLFLESTYGNRLHMHTDKRLEKLAKIINDTYNRGGKLIIPVFAVERTQELLFTLEQLYKKKMIPRQKVFLDSPLAIKATQIFRRHPSEYKSGIKFDFVDLEETLTNQSSMEINVYTKPAIIMAGSGMCDAGRMQHHIKHQIWDPLNTMLFVGYQAYGTLGREIISGEKNINVMGYDVVVKAKIQSLDSFSGHADQKMLLSWVKNFTTKPKKVFLIHGEEESISVLSQKINDLGLNTQAPKLWQTISL